MREVVTKEDGDEVSRSFSSSLSSSPSPTSDFLTAKNTVFDGGYAATISAPAVLFRVREGPSLPTARKSFARICPLFFLASLEKKEEPRSARRSDRSATRIEISRRSASSFIVYRSYAACVVSSTHEDRDDTRQPRLCVCRIRDITRRLSEKKNRCE